MDERYTSAMAHFCTKTTVFDAMQTIRDAGFDGLDFPISVYSRPLDSPLRKDDWRQWVQSVRDFSYEIGLPVSDSDLILPCGASGRWSAI